MAQEYKLEEIKVSVESDRNDTLIANQRQQNDSTCKSSFELVMIGLTLPLWTFLTLYILLLLIHYLRRLQYFTIYDKCTPRNAYFQYDFHMVAGRHSTNYARHEASIILDLLDNQSIPTMSVQIPGATLYNDQHVFLYRHSRADLRCVKFTVYRRHPIKDVRCVRIAHSCPNTDSRLYIYGIDLHDVTNCENKFFPINQTVKNRGTQWALMTTFEPKAETSFKKLGVECYDPFGFSYWPNYLEMLTVLLYIWCTSFCFGHLIGIKQLSSSISLHVLTILSITTISGGTICFIYLRFIKTHVIDTHFDSLCSRIVHSIYVITVIIISIAFWTLALAQSKSCLPESIHWLISTATCSIFLSIALLITWIIFNCKRNRVDRAVRADTDSNLAKTNSRENIQFVADPTPNICALLCTNQQPPKPESSRYDPTPRNTKQTLSQPAETMKLAKVNSTGKKKKKNEDKQHQSGAGKADDETLDTAFGVGSKYMKAKNRNSISQYV